MESQYWLFLTLMGLTGWGAMVASPLTAQIPASDRCLVGSESCAYQDYPQYNQEVNFRTPTQIQQRRYNSIENQCGDSHSTACNNLAPKVETIQDNPTLQQLRDQQIRTLH